MGWNLTGIHAVVIQKVRRFIEQRRQPRRLAGKKLMDLTYAKHDRAAPRNEDTVVVRKHAKVFVLLQIARSRFFPADTFGAEVQFVCINALVKEADYLIAIAQVPSPDIQRPRSRQAMALLASYILIDSNYFFVSENGNCIGCHLTQVIASEEGRGEDRPERHVRYRLIVG